MFHLLAGLIGVAIPMWGFYNMQKKFPIQNFIDLSTTTQSILFHPTWDVMLMFFICAAVFIYAVSTGRGRVVLILISAYIAYGIASFLFLHRVIFNVGIPQGSIPRLVLFGAVFLITLYFMFRIQIGSLIRSGMRDIAWWNLVLQSVMVSGLLSSFLYTFLSPAETKLLAPITRKLIGTPEVELLWIFVPFVWFSILNFLKRE